MAQSERGAAEITRGILRISAFGFPSGFGFRNSGSGKLLRNRILATSVMHRRFQQPWFSVMQRQPDAEGCPSTHLAFHFNPATVGADDPLHDH